MQNRSLSGETRSLTAFAPSQSPKTAMPSILSRVFLLKTLSLPAFKPVQSLETPMPTTQADLWHAHAVKLQNTASPKHALQRHHSHAKSVTPTDTRLSGQAPLEMVIIIDFQRVLTRFFQDAMIPMQVEKRLVSVVKKVKEKKTWAETTKELSWKR